MLLVLLLCFLSAHSWAFGPPDTPILRVETGRHTAPITCIDVDAGERLLVTGSLDKTVRLWDVQTGALLRTLRLPIAAGNEGKVYAVAISPDGQTVAVGGWTGQDWDGACSIYLFDTATGQLLGRFEGLTRIFALSFSPDGQWLAAGLGGNMGLFLYGKQGEGWQLEGEDLDSYKGIISGLAFSPMQAGQKTTWLVTTCYDGSLQLYSLDANGLQPRLRQQAGGGQRPHSAAFSPDGTKIAVGYADTTRVTIHDGRNLAKLYAADTQGVDRCLSSVAWSRDGRFLYGAGRYHNATTSLICQWARQGKGKRQEMASGVCQTITALHPVSGHRLVFGSARPAWGIVKQQEKPRVYGLPVIGDFRDNRNGLYVSADGRAIGFAYKDGGRDRADFSVDTLSLGTKTRMNPPQTAGLALQDWKNSLHPLVNGKKLSLEPYERSRSRAIASDGKSLLLGAELNLYSFAADGSLRWKQSAPTTAWAVNISANNRLAIAAFGDGTIRWYRYSDGKLLLSFFPHKDKQRWIAWTPSGYYAASPGGEKLMGWHNNRGVDHAAEFFPASRFRKQFYRPDVVKNILVTLDEQKALKKANAQGSKKHQQGD